MMMVQPRCLDEENGKWKMNQKNFRLFPKELDTIPWRQRKGAERTKLNHCIPLPSSHCSLLIQSSFLLDRKLICLSLCRLLFNRSGHNLFLWLN
jgi:hypothetical protein